MTMMILGWMMTKMMKIIKWMELGQLCFSNAIPCEYNMSAGVEDMIAAIGEILVEEKIVEANPCDNIGCVGNFENNVFVIRGYCWCDGDLVGHENGCPPNFEFKPTKFCADWYKYLGRGSSQSAKLKRKDVEEMRKMCLDSLKTAAGRKNQFRHTKRINYDDKSDN